MMENLLILQERDLTVFSEFNNCESSVSFCKNILKQFAKKKTGFFVDKSIKIIIKFPLIKIRSEYWKIENHL